MREWKDIPNYKKIYQASNKGEIRSLDRVSCIGRNLKGKVLTPNCSNGYWQVSLSKNGEYENYKVSVLVLTAFVGPRPDMYACHNDGKPKKLGADRLENLRWDTQSNNALDRNKHGTSNSKAVLCIETDIIYPSTHEAQRKTKIHHSSISAVCRGERKTAGGYHWRYMKKDEGLFW